MTIATSEAVLDYWFGSDIDHGTWQAEAKKWFAGGSETDAEIVERFSATVAAAEAGELDGWSKTAQGRLALIIVLDQFSRNVYRGKPAAFSNDPKALSLTLAGLNAGDDRALHPVQRLFFYMPMMHNEQLKLQQRCLEQLHALAAEASKSHPDTSELLTGSVNSATQHMEIIEQFGRFPHRNAIWVVSRRRKRSPILMAAERRLVRKQSRLSRRVHRTRSCLISRVAVLWLTVSQVAPDTEES